MFARLSRLCWLLIWTAPTWAQNFVIEPMTPDVSLFEVRVGASIWVKYGEHKIKVLPRELAGIQGLKRPPYSGVRFRVNKPARVFWVSHHHLLPGGLPPEGWRVFRQRAFQSTAERYREMDVYYRDYAAGECDVRFPYRSISAGIKPMDSTDVGDMALHVSSCSPRIVFRPEEDVALSVTVNNPTAKVQAWSVKYTIARAGRTEAVNEGTLAGKVEAGSDWTQRLTLGRLRAAFYLCQFTLCVGEREVTRYEYPLGVFAEPEPVAGDGNSFPMGVYNKFFLSSEPEVMTVYLAAAFDLLRRHSLNTLVINAIEASLPMLDLAREWGVKIVVRVDRDLPKEVMEHDAVLAYMMGDEPKLDDLDRYLAKYETIRKKHPERPIVTCMVGESVGTWAHNDPIPIWEQLKPRLRMARLYPFRKENYDLLSHTTYKPKLPPHAFFRWMSLYQEKFGGQWWYVSQTFGKDPTKERPDPYWRTPTGPEIRAMTHMALANGASGVLGWCLQSHAGYTALVRQRSLAPENGCLAVYGEVASAALRNREVLASLTPKRFEVRCEPWELLAIGRRGGAGRPYVYVINRGTKGRTDGRIWIPKDESKAKTATDVFSGEELGLTTEGGTSSISVSLAPGQGRLLALRP